MVKTQWEVYHEVSKHVVCVCEQLGLKLGGLECGLCLEDIVCGFSGC